MANTKLFHLGQIFILICISIVNANWGVPGDGQYHIQTDEGPERYFRYQTDSGQYRKEKRLSDGTVIGTDAWIDALGFLRQNDYIADHEGYRLLKSKTVYVGKNRPIQEAIKAAKKQSAKAGVVVKQNASTLTTPKKSITKHHSKTTTTTVLPIQSINDNPLGYDHYKTPLIVDIHPHSQPQDSNYLPPLSDDQYLTTTVRPAFYATPSSSSQSSIPPYLPPNNQYLNDGSQYTQQYPLPANVNRPPFSDPNSNNPYEPIAVYQPSSTPAPPTADYGPPLAFYPSSTPKPDYLDYGSSTTGRPASFNYPNNPFPNQINNEFGSSATGSPFSSSPYNRYGYQSATTPLPPPTPPQQNQQHYQSHYNHRNQYIPPQVSPSTIRPYLDANNDINNNNNNNNNNVIQPLFNRNVYQSPQVNGRFPQQYYGNNQIGNGYDQQFPFYDGVSATANGFRYFLPRQYHEEDNTDPNRRAGSFGYIDPFGIRRVTYYNTSPEGGFVHRKNNRYVGFNATPYDPRPL